MIIYTPKKKNPKIRCIVNEEGIDRLCSDDEWPRRCRGFYNFNIPFEYYGYMPIVFYYGIGFW